MYSSLDDYTTVINGKLDNRQLTSIIYDKFDGMLPLNPYKIVSHDAALRNGNFWRVLPREQKNYL